MHIKEFKENKEFKEDTKHDILFSIHWLSTQSTFLLEQGLPLYLFFKITLQDLTCF